MRTALPGPRILGRAAASVPEDPAPAETETETDAPVSPGPFADLAA